MPNSSPDSPMAGADRQTPRRLLRLHLPAEQVSLLVVAEAVEALAESDDWPAEARFHVDLVLEELVQNIVSYGFPDGRPGEFELTIDREGTDLIIALSDNGVAFDPFSLATPDTNLPLEERSIGGLGVHFTRTLMSAYGYRREGDRNRVELRKSLDSPISAD
jgi:anti-sigma regulatory factor (Ser/Thr protein kinase)